MLKFSFHVKRYILICFMIIQVLHPEPSHRVHPQPALCWVWWQLCCPTRAKCQPSPPPLIHRWWGSLPSWSLCTLPSPGTVSSLSQYVTRATKGGCNQVLYITKSIRKQHFMIEIFYKARYLVFY